MPKVTGSALPLSGLFAIDKPSGAITMKLLNQMKELLESSESFVKLESEDSRRDNYRKRKRGPNRRNPGGTVKLGQGGTLDPLASGVLVVGLNDGTKKLGNYLHGTKEYRATGLLGSSTDSYDSEGKRVRNAPFQHVTREKVEAVLSKFRGEIKQLPPIYSAIKMDGKPLYDYARQNKPLPRPIESRGCNIYNLELIDFKQGGEHAWQGAKEELTEAEKETMEKLERMVSGNTEDAVNVEPEEAVVTDVVSRAGTSDVKADNETADIKPALPPAFEIRMTVSSGTYVRSIVHDIGLALGSAAHVVELVRTRQGIFALDPSQVHTVEGEDDSSEPLRGVVSWSLIEEGCKEMKAKKAANGNNQRSQEGETGDNETMPWEEAIQKALQ